MQNQGPNKEQERLQEQAQQLKNDYEFLFGSEKGKRVLSDIKRAGFINQPTVNENATYMAVNEGRRTLALYILSMVNPEAKIKVQKKADV